MRKALLITNAGDIKAKETFCYGVYQDVNTFRNFLVTPQGGSWYPEEIDILDRPSITEVMSKLELLASYDYTFILFSGHGYVDKNGINVIHLKGECLEVTTLGVNATKRTIILDSCRTFDDHEYIRKSFPHQVCTVDDIIRHRILFDNCITNSKSGVIYGYACSFGENAEEHSSGGAYCHSLMTAAHDIIHRGAPSIHTFAEVHRDAAVLVKQNTGGRQKAEIEILGGGIGFPFVVMAKGTGNSV